LRRRQYHSISKSRHGYGATKEKENRKDIRKSFLVQTSSAVEWDNRKATTEEIYINSNKEHHITTMGKFLRDSRGDLVAIEGGLVLERTLDRKPRDCESCGFSKWAKKDKVFIIQGGSGMSASKRNKNIDGSSDALGGYVGGGSMEWICPDCAIKRGLPIEFYHKNFFSPGNAQARQYQEQQNRGQQQQQQAVNGGGVTGLPQGIEKILDITSSLCRF
jgi:surface antigen